MSGGMIQLLDGRRYSDKGRIQVADDCCCDDGPVLPPSSDDCDDVCVAGQTPEYVDLVLSGVTLTPTWMHRWPDVHYNMYDLCPSYSWEQFIITSGSLNGTHRLQQDWDSPCTWEGVIGTWEARANHNTTGEIDSPYTWTTGELRASFWLHPWKSSGSSVYDNLRLTVSCSAVRTGTMYPYKHRRCEGYEPWTGPAGDDWQGRPEFNYDDTNRGAWFEGNNFINGIDLPRNCMTDLDDLAGTLTNTYTDPEHATIMNHSYAYMVMLARIATGGSATIIIP